jgi:hypothetical protein
MNYLSPVDDATLTRTESRISTLSYVIVVLRPFNPSVHRVEDKVYWIDGIAKARNQMKWFVEKVEYFTRISCTKFNPSVRETPRTLRGFVLQLG